MAEKRTEPTAEDGVACTITPEEVDNRPHWVGETLVSAYLDCEERDDGYSYVFDGTDEALRAVATFVSNELDCCSFADYAISVTPPYEETRLTVTGPDGTKDLFDDEFITEVEESLSTPDNRG